MSDLRPISDYRYEPKRFWTVVWASGFVSGPGDVGLRGGGSWSTISGGAASKETLLDRISNGLLDHIPVSLAAAEEYDAFFGEGDRLFQDDSDVLTTPFWDRALGV